MTGEFTGDNEDGSCILKGNSRKKFRREGSKIRHEPTLFVLSYSRSGLRYLSLQLEVVLPSMQVEKVLYVTQCCAILAPRAQSSGVQLRYKI